MLGLKSSSQRAGLGSKYISIGGGLGHKMSFQPHSGVSSGKIEPNPSIHNNFNNSIVSRQPLRNATRF